jgi:hypothetical protein
MTSLTATESSSNSAGSGLFECQEVIAIGRSHRQIRFCDGESSVNPVSFDLRTLGDLGSGESELIELFDDTKLLNFEKRCSMSILSVLCEDAFDLSGVVGCLIADNSTGTLARSASIAASVRRCPKRTRTSPVAVCTAVIGTSTPRSLMLATKSLSRRASVRMLTTGAIDAFESR